MTKNKVWTASAFPSRSAQLNTALVEQGLLQGYLWCPKRRCNVMDYDTQDQTK